MMLAVESQAMGQLKLARFFPLAAHSANKAAFRRKLMHVMVGRGHPHLIHVVDRDRKRTWHVLVPTKMPRRHFVISPGEQKLAVVVELLHATDGSLRGE